MSGIVLAFVGGSYGGGVPVLVPDASLSGAPIMATAFGG